MDNPTRKPRNSRDNVLEQRGIRFEYRVFELYLPNIRIIEAEACFARTSIHVQ